MSRPPLHQCGRVKSHVFAPPLDLTIEKLSKGCNLRMYRLPMLSLVVRRMPSPYVPPRARKKAPHIPFPRPLVPKPSTKHGKITNLTYLATRLPSTTERTYPFIPSNTPWAPDLSSPPHAARISIACDPPKKKRRLRVSPQHTTSCGNPPSGNPTLSSSTQTDPVT